MTENSFFYGKNVEFRLNVESNISENNLSIVKEYWANENLKFLNQPIQVQKKFGLTQKQLINLVQRFSTMGVFYGQCKYCKRDLSYTIKSQYGKYYNAKMPSSCNLCKNYDNYVAYISKFYKDNKIENNFDKLISVLSKDELDLLYSIINYKEHKVIFEKVFNLDDTNEIIWEKLFKLGKLNLVPLNDYSTKNIMNINFNQINSVEIKKKETSNVDNDLNIVLRKNSTNDEFDPIKFSGKFCVENKFNFNPKVIYSYKVWLNFEGNLVLRIETVPKDSYW